MSSSELVNDLSKSNLFEEHFKTTKKEKIKHGVAMGRVSTKEQKDQGSSDAAQIERIRDYAVKNEIIIKKEWDVSETASKHSERKNFNNMLEHVTNSQTSSLPIKHIIFSHQSRSNRNRESARAIEELIRNHDVYLHCVRDGLVLHKHSTIDDWLRWDIFNTLNAKFIEDHKKNVFDGIKGRLAKGLFPGYAPYGYRNVRLPGGLSIFKVVEEEAEFIIKAFELSAMGNYSAPMLWEELCNLFPLVKKPTSHKSLYRLLRKRFYCGEFEYAGRIFKSNPEYQPALISHKLWKKSNDYINGHKRIKPSKKQLHYLGMIECGGYILDSNEELTGEKCGCKVTAEPKRKKLKDGTIKEYF